MSSLFFRRSVSESSENLTRSPSLASIREQNTSDSWSTHENDDDRNEKIQQKNARDPASIERSNLVNICKLVVKELLEQSLRYGRMLDSDHLPLQHFFIILEHILRHGLRPKKGLLGPKKELWDLLQSVEKYSSDAQDVTSSIRDLPTVRTHTGRSRAWLRLALMQKKLADYLQALIEHKNEILVEYYEPHALMLSDEIVIIMGILVGLNVIDCNLCVKGEDLDSQQGVIDFSLYLRSSSRASPEEEQPAIEGGGNMTAVLDQKNYIEELNRHLNATVANLQQKVEQLTTTNALMKEDLAIARNGLLTLQAENAALRQTQNSSQQQIADRANVHDRIDPEMAETLTAERRKRQDAERELELQVCLKAETEMAMKLLEKDIHEKQDTIISLRRQLEDIKQINLEMYRKLQECETELTQKGEIVERLQIKACSIGKILSNLEKRYTQNSHGEDFMKKSPSGQMFGSQAPPSKKAHLRIQAIPPFNANKIRKSPSNSENVEVVAEILAENPPETPKEAEKTITTPNEPEETITTPKEPEKTIEEE